MATPDLSRLSRVLVWAKGGSASPKVRSSSDNFFIPPLSRRRVGNLTTTASCQISSSGNGWGEPAACRLQRFEVSCRRYPNSESEIALRRVPLLVQNEFTPRNVAAANQRGFYERKNY